MVHFCRGTLPAKKGERACLDIQRQNSETYSHAHLCALRTCNHIGQWCTRCEWEHAASRRACPWRENWKCNAPLPAQRMDSRSTNAFEGNARIWHLSCQKYPEKARQREGERERCAFCFLKPSQSLFSIPHGFALPRASGSLKTGSRTCDKQGFPSPRHICHHLSISFWLCPLPGFDALGHGSAHGLHMLEQPWPARSIGKPKAGCQGAMAPWPFAIARA